MAVCNICPRRCGVDRARGVGFCGASDTVKVARAAPHFWEEPCISGTKGSGAVFFSGCNLRCVYCQNARISHGGFGREVSTERLAEIFSELQAAGVHNINLVTPTHYARRIAAALDMARSRGLRLPVVWNSSCYESAETLRALAGKVDVYLPDFKYKSAALAARYSGAPDYAERAREALDEMVLQRGGAVFEGGLMRRGVLVRHLVLPGCAEDSKSVLAFLKRRYGGAVCLSIMRQYTPVGEGLPDELSRRVTDAEYDEVLAYAAHIGIDGGYFQEKGAADEGFVPPFDLAGVCGDEL